MSRPKFPQTGLKMKTLLKFPQTGLKMKTLLKFPQTGLSKEVVNEIIERLDALDA